MLISVSKKKHFFLIKNCWKKNLFFKKNWWTIIIDFTDINKIYLKKVYIKREIIKKNWINFQLKWELQKKKKKLFRLVWFRFYKLHYNFQSSFFNLYLSFFDKESIASCQFFNKFDFALFRQQIWLEFWDLRVQDYEKYCYYQKKWRFKYIDNLPLFVRNFFLSSLLEIYHIPKIQIVFQNFFLQLKDFEYWKKFKQPILFLNKSELFLFLPKEQIYWLLLNFYFIKYWLEDNQLINFRKIFNYYKVLLPKIFFIEKYKFLKNFNFFIFLKKKGMRLINFFFFKHFTFQLAHSLHHNLLFYDTLFSVYNIWQIFKVSLQFFNFSLFFFNFSKLYNATQFTFFFLFEFYNIFQIFFYFSNFFLIWKWSFLIGRLQTRVIGFFSGIDKFTNFLYALTGVIFHFDGLQKIFFYFSFFDALFFKKLKEISVISYLKCLQIYLIALLSSYFFQNLKKWLINKYMLVCLSNDLHKNQTSIFFYHFWFCEFYFFCVKKIMLQFLFFNYFKNFTFELFFFFDLNKNF